jgi:hypothetical protein
MTNIDSNIDEQPSFLAFPSHGDKVGEEKKIMQTIMLAIAIFS